MKIAIACKSILLEKALKIFLRPYLVPVKYCEFVVSDSKIKIDKPIFLIGNDSAHLPLPFSKTSLLLALEEFSTCLLGEKKQKSEIAKEVKDFSILENKINMLTDKFRKDLIQTIKSHYEI